MATTESRHQFTGNQPDGEWHGLLLSTLAELHTATDLQHKKRELRIMQVFVFLFIGFLISMFLREAIVDIINGLPKGDWGTIFKALAAFFPWLTLIPGMRLIFAKYQTIVDKGLPLRTRLADKDTVPPVTDQPSLLKGEETSITPIQIGPLKHWKIRATISTIAGIFFFILPIGLIVLFVYFVPLNSLLLQPESFLNFLNGFFIFLCLCLSLLFTSIFAYMFLVSAWQASNGARVTADQWGISWRQSTRGKNHRASMPWHEVQGFYCISYLNQRKRKITLYLLDGNNTSLSWKIKDRSKREILEASELLARYIVTWTRQPLRDLSAIATEVLKFSVAEQSIDPS